MIASSRGMVASRHREMATTPNLVDSLQQSWPKPTQPRPIVVIGAGSIVRDAHLPIYSRLGFPVAGIFDVNPAAARERAEQFRLPRAFDSMDDALAVEGAIFDIAVPPDQIAGILQNVRAGSAVLIQKPMGRDLADARRILALCRERRLVAAMNFQLRFAPNMLALRDATARGMFGGFTDLEVRIVLHTPWNYWAFLKGVPRLEVLMHSIHYLDLVRSILGEPRAVYCKGVRHPALGDYADSRTSIILDYGDTIRASLTMNHTHRFGSRHAVSEMKLEGTHGAAIAKMGVNLNYPHGEPDRLQIHDGHDWREVALRGSWFLEAFEGPMSNLQRFVAGEDQRLVSPIEDAFKTMALVEACYESSTGGGEPIARE
jgi:predicted dehydrogenase